MLGLSGVVAIAASGAAIFIAFSVVGIVVWVRVRKERHALALLNIRQGNFGRSLQTLPADTLTELSKEEGAALRAHGQLPFGKPGEWGQLTSRESLLRPKHSSDSFTITEKARSLRHSLSRSRSKRLSKSSHKHRRLSSLVTVSEADPHHHSSPPPKSSMSRDDIPLSAVEGVLELPAERTPSQTPEMNREDSGFHVGMRPVSPAWPLPTQKDRGSMFPVVEDHNSPNAFDPPPRIFDESSQRVRGTSITSQTAGSVPEHSIPPPPPSAWPPDRFSYARDASTFRLSSMSLDTTNSSILDDGRNGPRSADTEITSPIFPSFGTFVPYSANDVGFKDGRRSFIATNTSMPPMHNFPIRSSSTAEGRRKTSDHMSPRRSMTVRHSSNSSDRFSAPPRRSESLSSNPPSRHASLRSGTPVSMNGYQNSNPPNWRVSNSQMAFVPHFSQFQRSSACANEPRENDPFYGGSPRSSGSMMPIGSPGSTGSYMPPSPMQRSSLSLKGPLPSALKGGNSQRKGHRRQNCVRISIHPPMTFGGPPFSPTVEEEPEDFDKMEELDLRESAINDLSKSQPAIPLNTTSPLPPSKRNKYDSRRSKATPGSLGPLAEEPQTACNKSPAKKRKNAPINSTDEHSSMDKSHALPDIFTSLPPTITDVSLSHTPSPERAPAVWSLHENAPPRRTGIKGPRTQPPRATRSNSTRTSSKPMDELVTSPVAGSPSRLPLITGTQGSDWRKSTDSLYRTRTDAAGSPRRTHDPRYSPETGLGSSSLYGRARMSTVRDRVTIWEDANRGGSPPKPPAAQLAGVPPFGVDISPTRSKNAAFRSLPPTDPFPSRVPSHRAPPTPVSARFGMTTPTSKSLGLGIGCTTPVSLYDGDGFLKE
ncbi:hypothetical protein NUU61_001782 [Penicillium alfredii]|uniref:Uncharacterized protein n=1 Tax=Penicillium alfredii TaxID=1506179 RepID=A0A9W9FQZ5_9EURO|nr:uncharacterized protein NUU61_001782 [Penicillium alfredii]KAJ5104435.1 hypothetical protein NUU61_001782 [Penicillium alfredii]